MSDGIAEMSVTIEHRYQFKICLLAHIAGSLKINISFKVWGLHIYMEVYILLLCFKIDNHHPSDLTGPFFAQNAYLL